MFAMLLGIPAGIFRCRQTWHGIIDHGLMGAALTGYSMPIFWWGLLLIMFMSEYLGLTPISGPHRSDSLLR